MIITFILLFCLCLSNIFAEIVNQKFNNTCNIISFSGGGSHGAIELGMLDTVINNYPNLENTKLITGISAGALNAGYLMFYPNNIKNGVKDMIKFYNNITNDKIYNSKSIYSLFSKDYRQWGYYSSKPLRETISNFIFLEKKFNLIPTLVGATNVNIGKLFTFRLDETLYYLGKNYTVDILMASSAIPPGFPPIKINNDIFNDGGVLSNELLDVHEIIPECNKYFIHLFSSSAPIKSDYNFSSYKQYLERVASIITNGFDNTLIKRVKCKNSKGILYNHYPIFSLNNYSILDFNKGSELINRGRVEFTTDQYDYCF